MAPCGSGQNEGGGYNDVNWLGPVCVKRFGLDSTEPGSGTYECNLAAAARPHLRHLRFSRYLPQQRRRAGYPPARLLPRPAVAVSRPACAARAHLRGLAEVRWPAPSAARGRSQSDGVTQWWQYSANCQRRQSSGPPTGLQAVETADDGAELRPRYRKPGFSLAPAFSTAMRVWPHDRIRNRGRYACRCTAGMSIHCQVLPP